jgi:hypothetical protein
MGTIYRSWGIDTEASSTLVHNATDYHFTEVPVETGTEIVEIAEGTIDSDVPNVTHKKALYGGGECNCRNKCDFYCEESGDDIE